MTIGRAAPGSMVLCQRTSRSGRWSCLLRQLIAAPGVEVLCLLEFVRESGFHRHPRARVATALLLAEISRAIFGAASLNRVVDPFTMRGRLARGAAAMTSVSYPDGRQVEHRSAPV